MNLEGTKLPKEKLGPFFGLMKEMHSFQKRGIFERCMSSMGGCQEPPIASHLLAESWLRTIADATNHVITFEMGMRDLSGKGLCIEPIRVGVGDKSAVTFPGFCRKHDSEIFSCLESEEFTATPAQLLALTYRSVCREACSKHQMVKCNLPRALDSGPNTFFAHFVIHEMKNCIHLLSKKQELEESLLVPKNDIAAYVVKFAKRPTLLVSVTAPLAVTFTGRLLDTNRNDWTTLSIIPSKDGGYAIFTWSKRACKNPSRLVKSFIGVPRELQSSALVYFALETSENFAVAPAWWNTLSLAQRHDLQWRFSRNFNADRNEKSIPSMVPKSPGLVNWEVVNADYA